jgi:phospholipid/cholesterol/gamma-HCH transport system substrate-binding protein
MMRTRKLAARKRRKSFSEMDLGLIGAIGLVVTSVLLVGALNIGKVLSVLGETTYTAALTEAGGLRSGDDVRIAGLKVGKVKDVELRDDHVQVTFGLENVDLGDQTRAIVKSDNALGSKFLAIEPGGSGNAENIPLERTDAGFAVNEELGKLTTSTSRINSEQLADSFSAISAVLAETPDEFKAALKGVSALSQTLSSRDEELAAVLQKASSVSQVLADRNQEVTSILSDGSKLFGELAMRREILGALLRNVRSATNQMVGLVDDNKTSLKPALTELRQTARLLTEYRGTLDFALKNVGRYVRSLGDSVAGGPFFQAYLANLASPEDLVTGGVTGIIEQEGSGF